MSSSEPRPASLNAGRLLGLRRFPGMDQMSLEEARKVLAAMTEQSIPAGTRLCSRGTPVAAAWFVIEGELSVGHAGDRRSVGPGAAIGMVEVLAQTASGLDVECTSGALLLVIDAEDLLALLAEEFGLLIGAIRGVSAMILQRSPAGDSGARVDPPRGARPLSFVDRLLFLEELGAFATAGAETLAELAGALSERAVNGILARAGDSVEYVYIVVDGCLRHGVSEIPAGTRFGEFHGLGECPLAFDLVADAGTRVLTCPMESMIDMLEDDVPLALTWLREISVKLLELTARHIGIQESDAPRES